jgi:hypothetical protein
VHDVLEDRLSRHILPGSEQEEALLPRDGGESLNASGLYFLAVSIVLGFFGAGATFAFVPLFRALCDDAMREYIHGVAEGVSGGMYAGKIAGLFIPQLQAFGFRSDLGSRLRHNLFTILFFSLGVCFTLLTTLVPPLNIS